MTYEELERIAKLIVNVLAENEVKIAFVDEVFGFSKKIIEEAKVEKISVSDN